MHRRHSSPRAGIRSLCTGTGLHPRGTRAQLVGKSLEYAASSAMISRAMQLNRFDLNLLIALDALLREKNVTRAAERVFVSQPAMSAALHKLREYFNDPLLVRVGREMELTPRGDSLVEPVREALLRIQVMLGTQPTFDPKTARREFTVIMSEEAVPGVLPRAAAHPVQRGARARPAHRDDLAHRALAARVRRGGSVPVPGEPADVRSARLSRDHPVDAAARGELGVRGEQRSPDGAGFADARAVRRAAAHVRPARRLHRQPRTSWCGTCWESTSGST